MPQLSTGLVIAGAYADKLRRVLFAQLRDMIKRGEIDNKTVAMRAGELNRLLFDILVNKLKLDKGDAVRIRIEYDVKDGDIVWKLDTLRIEAFRRIPDEEVEKVVKESIKRYEEILASEVTEEERAWTEAREREVEREVQKRAEAARAAVSGPRLYSLKDLGVEVTEAVFYGTTRSGEYIAVLKDNKGENIGMAVVEPVDSASRITIVLVPGQKKAYKATTTANKPADKLRENPEEVVNAATVSRYIEIDRKEAEDLIRQKLEELE
jgi:hypothetical protein